MPNLFEFAFFSRRGLDFVVLEGLLNKRCLTVLPLNPMPRFCSPLHTVKTRQVDGENKMVNVSVG